jgi:NAD dependent epimerase/dehydratase family enzyme
MKLVIRGGSEQVGYTLARHFHAEGHTVIVLSRAAQPAPLRAMMWDGLTPGARVAGLEQSDVCINFAGRSVNCRDYHRFKAHSC